MEAKNLMQTSAKVCAEFALKFSSFSLSIKLFRVICPSCQYFYHAPPHQTFIVFCQFANVNRYKGHLLPSPGSETQRALKNAL